MNFPACLLVAALFSDVVVCGEPVGSQDLGTNPDQLRRIQVNGDDNSLSRLATRNLNAPEISERQISEDGRCGTGFGTRCYSDECCSSAGYKLLLPGHKRFC